MSRRDDRLHIRERLQRISALSTPTSQETFTNTNEDSLRRGDNLFVETLQ